MLLSKTSWRTEKIRMFKRIHLLRELIFCKGCLKNRLSQNFLIKNWTNFVKIRTDFSNLKEEEKIFSVKKFFFNNVA